MDFHSRGIDVSRIAEIRQPHVLYVEVIESLGTGRNESSNTAMPRF